jgi:hypothetical protein
MRPGAARTAPLSAPPPCSSGRRREAPAPGPARGPIGAPASAGCACTNVLPAGAGICKPHPPLPRRARPGARPTAGAPWTAGSRPGACGARRQRCRRDVAAARRGGRRMGKLGAGYTAWGWAKPRVRLGQGDAASHKRMRPAAARKRPACTGARPSPAPPDIQHQNKTAPRAQRPQRTPPVAVGTRAEVPAWGLLTGPGRPRFRRNARLESFAALSGGFDRMNEAPDGGHASTHADRRRARGARREDSPIPGGGWRAARRPRSPRAAGA